MLTVEDYGRIRRLHGDGVTIGLFRLRLTPDFRRDVVAVGPLL